MARRELRSVGKLQIVSRPLYGVCGWFASPVHCASWPYLTLPDASGAIVILFPFLTIVSSPTLLCYLPYIHVLSSVTITPSLFLTSYRSLFPVFLAGVVQMTSLVESQLYSSRRDAPSDDMGWRTSGWRFSSLFPDIIHPPLSYSPSPAAPWPLRRPPYAIRAPIAKRALTYPG